MIFLSNSNGLGNQMFAYAFARWLSMKNEDEEISFKTPDRARHGWGGLNNFNVRLVPAESWRKHMTLKQMALYLRYKQKRAKCTGKDFTPKDERYVKFLEKNALYLEYKYIYYHFNNMNRGRDKFIEGLFASPQYFNNIKEVLRQEFTPREPVIPHNIELINKINSCESVCIQIRRGDYLNNFYKDTHYVCGREYFVRAISKMREIHPKACFFVFSNDLNWCKRNLDWKGIDVSFEEGYDPVWETMRLMYSCKHFIISNSSFAWWAQYLCRNDRKTVIAPDRWVWGTDEKGEKRAQLYSRELLDPAWILLPIRKENLD